MFLWKTKLLSSCHSNKLYTSLELPLLTLTFYHQITISCHYCNDLTVFSFFSLNKKNKKINKVKTEWLMQMSLNCKLICFIEYCGILHFFFQLSGKWIWHYFLIMFEDGKTLLDLALCYGKDFKSYDLAKLPKLVPANRYLWMEVCMHPPTLG